MRSPGRLPSHRTDILVRRGNLDKGTPEVCRQRDKLVRTQGEDTGSSPGERPALTEQPPALGGEECGLLKLWSVVLCPWTRTAGFSEASPGRQATVTGSNVVVLGWDCTHAGTWPPSGLELRTWAPLWPQTRADR